ncbi:cation diffusion facilitator family transporter [Enterovirga sp.]|jgi:cation diffusion facilitator family transporter|uniref:cation diffusion facilitator family transporter n=1 Tax=Enterovirga sp. TaxID=2026350 RepID=UPI0026085CE3|nr:cation diffusion facilitator family transporter [Enterovirga sp.]MDB5593020.1 cadmium transporter [Enterovirga sp.]
MDQRLALAAGSIGIAAAVLGLKYAAYWLTGSVALYSDALESLINIVTALVALWAIKVSLLPADEGHPYGHAKAEYFSAVLEGVLIVVAALLILREAYLAWLTPRSFEQPALGLAVNALATVLNAGWAFLLLRRGRALRSQALIADGRHLLADVVTSVGVIVGLAAAAVTGISALDPALAAFVALNILWSGWRVITESLGGLMDEAVPAATLARIRDIISLHAAGALEAHDLRTRHAGQISFVDFHLVVPGHLSVSDAHDICDGIERALKAELGAAHVTIHVEPEDKAKHSGIVVL